MRGQYLTDHIKSEELMNKALEAILPESKWYSTPMNNNHSSKGEGISTGNFFLGNFITDQYEKIGAENLKHLIFSVPKKGIYSFRSSNKSLINEEYKSGTLVCGVDEALYTGGTDLVHNYLVMVEYKELLETLYRKFGIQDLKGYIQGLDIRHDKVRSLYNYIDSTCNIIKSYAGIRDSLIAKMNLKEITLLMVSDLIGDLLNKNDLQNNSRDKRLVLLAEDIMESQFDSVTTIQEIAGKVYTSTRNLQKAFKKYRDYTPSQFLKRCKLQRANQLLKDQYSSSTVKNVALSVGFFDLNRFSKYYFEQYGEYPSDTVSRK